MCKRCDWGTSNQRMMDYHDNEWGVPLHDDCKLFEFLVLEVFQAGLSWQIILNKREAFRRVYERFNPERVAKYDDKKLEELVQDKSIIRNKMKIAASINNAQRFLEVQKEFGCFDKYIWKFVDYKPIVNSFNELGEIPAKTELSDIISADLKKRGFKFVGSTVIYAYMQATGMLNDHLADCVRYDAIINGYQD